MFRRIIVVELHGFPLFGTGAPGPIRPSLPPLHIYFCLGINPANAQEKPAPRMKIAIGGKKVVVKLEKKACLGVCHAFFSLDSNFSNSEIRLSLEARRVSFLDNFGPLGNRTTSPITLLEDALEPSEGRNPSATLNASSISFSVGGSAMYQLKDTVVPVCDSRIL